MLWQPQGVTKETQAPELLGKNKKSPQKTPKTKPTAQMLESRIIFKK